MSSLLMAQANLMGGGAGYDASVLDDAPVAYWKCDEQSGSTVFDSSGNGHHLTATFSGGNTMATVSEAPRAGFSGVGRALAMNLAASTVVRNTTPSATLRFVGKPITFEFVFKRDSSTYQWIIFNGSGNGGINPTYFEVRKSENYFDLKAAGAIPSVSFTHGISDTNPHLIHIILNAERNSLSYYRDGVFVETRSVSGWNSSGTGEQLYLGRRADGNTPGSTWVNNVALYDKALDAARIAERWARRDIP